jgi:hypothetical protein
VLLHVTMSVFQVRLFLCDMQLYKLILFTNSVHTSVTALIECTER